MHITHIATRWLLVFLLVVLVVFAAYELVQPEMAAPLATLMPADFSATTVAAIENATL